MLINSVTVSVLQVHLKRFYFQFIFNHKLNILVSNSLYALKSVKQIIVFKQFFFYGEELLHNNAFLKKF